MASFSLSARQPKVENGSGPFEGPTPFTIATLGLRLRARRTEIEEAILARSVASGTDCDTPSRAQREAIRSCLELVILVLEHEDSCEDLPLVPLAAVLQARRVGRSGRSLSTMLQGYICGYGTLWDFVLEEIDQAPVSNLDRAKLRRVASTQLTSVARHVLPMVVTAHNDERFRRPRSRGERTASIVRAMLQGSRVDTEELGYDVHGSHIGLIAAGADAAAAVSTLARKLKRWHLLVHQEDGAVWAWLSGAEPVRGAAIPDLGQVSPGLRISCGEPASGQKGFCVTHLQAEAAMQVALHQRQLVTHYADVLLLVPAIEDERCGDSLISIYLSPLETSQERNPSLKDTLQAYFTAELNTTATAARLKIDRRTAMTRLRTVEERLGFPIYERHAELELALRLDYLRRSTRLQSEEETDSNLLRTW